MRLWCYQDFSGWGKDLRSVAVSRGHDARMFSKGSEPDHGTVFVRLHHHPDVRARDKAVMADLALNPALELVPCYRAARLYDDKAQQARELAKWMPRTAIVTSPEDAEAAIDRIGLPLMSKCSEGAGSYNVRFIQTRDDAMSEVSQAFGKGISCHYGQRQKGYLLWQSFCAGNDYDFRVIAIGNERLILRRHNRDDRPMASGSNKEDPITWPDQEASEVLGFTDEFFAEEGFPWCGVDVVRDHEAGEWRILEMTIGWPLKNMGAHRFVSGRSGSDYWQIVMDELEAGRCSM
jgi:hypothetical protein